MTKSKRTSDPADIKQKTGPDALLQSTAEGATQLSEEELDKVAAGGKAKTADKAFNAMEGYVRG
jgi:hypothetical protein